MSALLPTTGWYQLCVIERGTTYVGDVREPLSFTELAETRGDGPRGDSCYRPRASCADNKLRYRSSRRIETMPKEMLPLIDKPIIQYVVEELVEAGIKDIIIIGSANKRAIEDHFDTPNEELLANLRAGGAKKQPLIDVVQRLSEMANFVYIRQKGPYGNATPLTCASHLIMPGESVIYTFADDFIEASPSRFRQMIEASQQLDGAILSCKKIVEDAEFDRYGVVNGQQVKDGVIKMTN